MQNFEKKYRLFIYLLYPLYVNFVFLTPFLHYHSADENSFSVVKVDVHSHIIDLHNDEHNHESNHHLDDCSNHEELYQGNTYQFTSLTKFLSLTKINNLYSNTIVPPKSTYLEYQRNNTPEMPALLEWEIFVNISTNTSPPA